MGNVKLLDGVFKRSQEKGKEYLLYLDVDRLIAPCYEAIGLEAKKPRYGGWEATQIAGHSIGHWLSAASAMYIATKDEDLLAKLKYAVNELAYLQSLDPEDYVSGFAKDCFDRVFTGEFEVERFSLGGSWVPWYSIHKIYAGLIDVYSLVGNKTALEVVIKLADWAKQGTDHLDNAQFEKMLICEYGGMNEVMVDLYNITGNKDYLELAIRFCHHEVLDPLSKGLDELEGMHANTQIPKVIGAAKLYEATGDEKFKKMALFFWDQVTKYRSYIMGGNSNYEHFGPHNQEKLGVQTAETCNTYNMLILTEILYSWEQKAEYMDYYEKALYNHILASQDPDSGMKMYFLSTQPGHFKVYNSPDDSFWCCTGTGMENPARYNRNIYYRKNEKVYVNLFIASEWTSDDKKIKLSQVTDFPHSEKVVIRLEKAESPFLNMHIRVPYWVSGPITIMINGDKVDVIANDGYIMIERNWSTGDIMEINLPMSLHTYEAKDNPNKVGILYGPIVLAGALGTKDFPESDILGDHLKLNNHTLIDVPNLIADRDNIEAWITRVDNGSLEFETDHVGQPGNSKLTLIPFYELHHQRYTIYWNMMDEETYKTFVDDEKEQMEKLRKITVDFVQPGEQQPEVEHGVKSKNSQTGYLNIAERMWRDSLNDGFFGYEMAVIQDQQMYLQVTYFDGDKFIFADGKWYEQDFTIVADGIKIAEQRMEGKRSDRLFNICYEIPFDLTKDKEKIEVTFVTTEGKASGGIFGVRIVNEKS
ncbi:glycoside hydrolase family 127 protein [Lederbergia lenta]|uniref:Acetyl-CoA carboxylase, biotin carboxylase n=1 Tax=Lederbergia lenta TaxID=1467 RepID=A0A2X4WH58_LEDLE|nr:glycoside hydrolase family 127 protein [Lederbergia lenta]MEC2322998.1 glycoside hydrolase family 127 protein [Lederbergia lenta]SQI62179.1 acetyl-CoA carboxylase, biotin carboxylase [Lederbergia lenta]